MQGQLHACADCKVRGLTQRSGEGEREKWAKRGGRKGKGRRKGGDIKRVIEEGRDRMRGG